jgi:hypothetical protein
MAFGVRLQNSSSFPYGNGNIFKLPVLTNGDDIKSNRKKFLFCPLSYVNRPRYSLLLLHLIAHNNARSSFMRQESVLDDLLESCIHVPFSSITLLRSNWMSKWDSSTWYVADKRAPPTLTVCLSKQSHQHAKQVA